MLSAMIGVRLGRDSQQLIGGEARSATLSVIIDESGFFSLDRQHPLLPPPLQSIRKASGSAEDQPVGGGRQGFRPCRRRRAAVGGGGRRCRSTAAALRQTQ